MSYRMQELITLCEHRDSPLVFGGVRVGLLFSFRCSVLFVFLLCLVYPMLPVSLNCPFLNALSVFSNVYQNVIYYVSSHIYIYKAKGMILNHMFTIIINSDIIGFKNAKVFEGKKTKRPNRLR